jgi:hypothetical protein
MENKRYYKKKGGEAHMGREWDFDESSTDSSSDEDAANIAINKGLLIPNVGHKCLMAKDNKKKKVHSRDTPKYTTSDDEGSSSDIEDDLTSLFANLTKNQKQKINELIESINEKDDLLECQEDLCDGTSQVIRPTYSCPCLTDIRHPVDVPKSLDKFGIFPYLTRNVSPVLQTLQNIGDKEMRKQLHKLTFI